MEASRSKYRIEKTSFNELDSTVVLPSFQRKLVWSKTEKKNFIETLHNGYPFGAILVYKYPHEEKISLIDGLQRFTTIRDYRDNPQEYVPIDEFIDELTSLFISENTPSTTSTHYRNTIEKVLKNFISNLEENTNSMELYNRLKENLVGIEKIVTRHLEGIMNIRDNLVNTLKSYLDIAQIDIPTIVFTGSDTELATVFENLNRGGKKLSKYQVFAAQWYKYEITLSDSPCNKEILDRTISWYESLENERGIEIENFDPDKMREDARINIAELCFAFGQMILDVMPVFWSNDTVDTANEIGYSTMAIILGIKNKDLSTIIEEKNRILFEKPELIEAIIDSALIIYKDINNVFQKYLHMPNEPTNFKNSLGTNFQILSFFAALWNARKEVNKSRLTLQSIPNSSREYDFIRNNLLKWYIYDIVEGNWSGSGDSKLDQIAIGKINKYLHEVASEQLSNSLMKWYDNQLQKRSINFEPIAKMIYTINASFDSNWYGASKCDLEHVIPRKLIQKTANNVIISGGTLGNLMFLDSSINRAKKEKFMYTYINNDAFKVNQEFIDLHFYPQKKNLIAVKIELESTGNDYSNTQAVIKNRGNDIITALVKQLG